MATVEIRITHVSWRQGRPRFQPGPKLRALGFTGQDLRHPGGAWYSPEECKAWIEGREADIAAAKSRARTRTRARPRRDVARFITVEAVLEAWFATPRMAGQTLTDGKRSVRAVAPATVRDYRQKARALAAFDPVIHGAPAEALTRPVLYDLYERLWSARGLATANGVIAVLSAALAWAMRAGRIRLAVNPCEKLGRQSAPPRIRAGTVPEMRALVAAADAMGRAEIGDAIMLGLWTGQRQKDRLELVEAGLYEGRRLFRQSKTGAVVDIFEAPELTARLAAARQRRAGWPVQPLHVIVDETTRQPFRPDWFRHVFASVRDHAALTCPSLAGFRDQDLRDTSVTWLARAGCTVPEIARITGHSDQSVHQILKHYLASHPEIGDNAIAKMIGWYDRQEA